MKAYKCDRCGGFGMYEGHAIEGEVVWKVWSHLKLSKDSLYSYSKAPLELCDSCMSELALLVKGWWLGVEVE